MDYSFLQMSLNSGLGVACGMLFIAKRIRQPRKHAWSFVAVLLFFLLANLWFLVNAFPLPEAIWRAITIAMLPFLLGYGWSFVLPHIHSQRNQ